MKTALRKSKTYTLDQIKDEMIGKSGTAKRDQYESELTVEMLGDAIRNARKKRNLTQEELGSLVGVGKAQISKIENNTTNVTVDTILKVFDALKAKISFSVEIQNKTFKIV